MKIHLKSSIKSQKINGRFWLPDNRNCNHANRAGSYFCGPSIIIVYPLEKDYASVLWLLDAAATLTTI
jgi:hypothetical protein